jgi:uncharacterized SAM-binding protein YcdF (DUF218 family)
MAGNAPTGAGPVLPGCKAVPKRKRSWISRIARGGELFFAWSGFIALLLVATPLTNWLFDVLACESKLTPAKYIICPGGDAARIIESARLLSEGYGEYLIVSNHGPFTKAMRDLAVEWGADPARILMDNDSVKTRHHARSIIEHLGVDPARDSCIVVTSYTHMARCKACFEKAGFKHLMMREPRWERSTRPIERNWKWRFKALPELIYEYAAWGEYWVRGEV